MVDLRVNATRRVLFAIALGQILGSARAQWESLHGGVTHGVVCFSPDPEGEYLLVGGNFPFVREDSLRVNNIAAWTGSSWSTDHTGGGSGDTSEFGNSSPVNSMVYWQDTLFIGTNDPTWQNDPGMSHGAYLTGDTVWHALPAQPSGQVFFYKVNDRLFMGANGNYLDTTFFPGVCEIVGGQFVPLPNIPLTGADIWTTEFWHGSYYFGGQISTLDAGSRNIVAYDGDGSWAPLATGIGGNFVRSIRGYGDSLYVGGYFLPGANVQSTHIQIWDGSVWHPFFPDEVVYSGQVVQMEVYDYALWILGTFQFLSGGPTYSVLRFDGHQLCAIGGPEYDTGSGSAMAFFQGYLYKGMGAEYPGLEFEHIARLPLEDLVPDECHEVVTAIPGRTGAASISLFPNPATDQLTLTGLEVAEGGSIEVIDMLGEPVLPPVRINGPSMMLDLSDLASGCYQLRAKTGSGTLVKPFVKQ